MRSRETILELFGLDDGRRRQLRAKDLIPESAGDAESVLVVKEVVLHVILLELLVPERQVRVVQEVMGQVVANVTENATAEHGCRCTPAVREQVMCELPERECQDDEHGRRHDEAISVHGQVVVDAMEQEMGCDANAIIGQPAVHSLDAVQNDTDIMTH
jgi:hypothetical protein